MNKFLVSISVSNEEEVIEGKFYVEADTLEEAVESLKNDLDVEF